MLASSIVHVWPLNAAYAEVAGTCSATPAAKRLRQAAAIEAMLALTFRIEELARDVSVRPNVTASTKEGDVRAVVVCGITVFVVTVDGVLGTERALAHSKKRIKSLAPLPIGFLPRHYRPLGCGQIIKE